MIELGRFGHARGATSPETAVALLQVWQWLNGDMIVIGHHRAGTNIQVKDLAG